MVIPVAVYLWIVQVEKYSIFPNIPTLLWRLSKVHFGWRQWLRKKVFISKHITPLMAFLLHLSSKTIVRSRIRSILLVGLTLNTRTELLKETLRQLPNGHMPTCFTWQPIGPNIPTQPTGLKQLTMQYGCSTDFQIWNLA
jgi:hypothetical protein